MLHSIGKPITLPSEHVRELEIHFAPLTQKPADNNHYCHPLGGWTELPVERACDHCGRSAAPILPVGAFAGDGAAADHPIDNPRGTMPWALAIIACLLLVAVVAVPDEWRIPASALKECRR